jgi:hypothetical protein
MLIILTAATAEVLVVAAAVGSVGVYVDTYWMLLIVCVNRCSYACSVTNLFMWPSLNVTRK